MPPRHIIIEPANVGVVAAPQIWKVPAQRNINLCRKVQARNSQKVKTNKLNVTTTASSKQASSPKARARISALLIAFRAAQKFYNLKKRFL